MLWIDATNLKNWASRRDCQGYLPLVIRRLVKATSKDIYNIDFPAGDSVVYPGWDGILKVSEGTEYIPEGLSVWEFGSNQNTKKKANDDYQKRKENPLNINPSDATFVFVTPRIWSDKNKWCQDKKKESFWKDVRAYDAEILEEWLEQVPAVGAWLARHLGIYPEGVIALEDWWNEWSTITNPTLSSKLVLAGRGSQVEEVKNWLSSPPSSKAVQTTTSDESLAFLAATINRMPEIEREFWLSRSLVVKNPESFSHVSVNDRARLLLILKFKEIEGAPSAVQKGHYVYVPLTPDNKGTTEKIILPRLGRDEFISAIKEMGLSEEDAQKYSRDTGRSLSVLRRRLTSISNQPEWAKTDSARYIIPVLLAGSWNELKQADKEIISEIAGESYDSYSKKLSIWLHKPDSPILKIGELWRLISPVDAWIELASFLTESDLKQLKRIALKVLGSINPALDLEPEKRWMSSVYGKEPLFSENLREGIAQTLVLIAVFGDSVKISISITSQTWVNNVVRELLNDAGWKLWNSISDVLPLIAEASPSSFLDATESSLSQVEPPIMSMFSETKGFLTSSSNHSGLLWALEGLAWDQKLLSRVTLVLGKLTRLDPGGSLSNRPANSLRTIFLLWLPRTFASLKQRFEAIDTLIGRELEAGCELLINLMPRSHDSSFLTHKPRWRQFIDKPEKRITLDEHIESIKELTKRIFLYVDNEGLRWAKIIENFSDLPLEERNKTIKYLSSCIDKITNNRSEVRNRLRKILSHHRAFSDADWALPEQELKNIESVYISLEPKDTIESYCWLFDEQWPELPEGEKRDYEKAELAIIKHRIGAVEAIKSQQGLDGLIRLAEQTTNSGLVGSTVAEVDLSPGEEKILFSLLEEKEKNKVIFIQNYIYRRSFKKGDEWINKLVKVARSQKWPAKKTINLFISFPQKKIVWNLLEYFNPDIREEYWRQCYVKLYNLSSRDKIYAIKQLLHVGRYFTALDTAALFIKELLPELIAEILHKTATENCEEDLRIQPYNVEKLFKALDSAADIKEEEIARLEWLYLPILSRVGSGRQPKTLHKELSKNPGFFSEVIKYTYKPKNEDKKEEKESLPQDLLKQRAQLAWGLLYSWKTIPGSDIDGKIDYDLLKTWVDKARELCKEADRREIGDTHIGKVLACSASEEEGVWPPKVVCKIIDELQNKEIDEGFRVEVYKKRGTISKSPFEGGQQERALDKRFTEYADKWAIYYPRTAAILTSVASFYKNEAIREDKEAERRDLEY